MTGSATTTAAKPHTDTGQPAGRSLWIKRVVGLVAAITALVVVVLASLAVGARDMPVSEVLRALFAPSGSADQLVVLALRLPRTVLGALVGMAPAVAGRLLPARRPRPPPAALRPRCSRRDGTGPGGRAHPGSHAQSPGRSGHPRRQRGGVLRRDDRGRLLRDHLDHGLYLVRLPRRAHRYGRRLHHRFLGTQSHRRPDPPHPGRSRRGRSADGADEGDPADQ